MVAASSPSLPTQKSGELYLEPSDQTPVKGYGRDGCDEAVNYCVSLNVYLNNLVGS